MKRSERFSDESSYFCKSLWSIYNCWDHRFTESLKNLDLHAINADSYIFYNTNKNRRLILSFYRRQDVSNLFEGLMRKFEITHAQVEIFLGLQVEQKPDGPIRLHQAAYAQKVIRIFRIENANAVSMSAGLRQEMCIRIHQIMKKRLPGHRIGIL